MSLKEENIVKKKSSDIECIIYVPNHPPEVFKSMDVQELKEDTVCKEQTIVKSPKNT